jgi:hypothetical protein
VCLTNLIVKSRAPTCLSLKHGTITSLDMPVEKVEMLSNKLGMYKQVHNYDSKCTITDYTSWNTTMSVV